MTMSDDQRREFAKSLFEAEQTRRWIEPLTATHVGATIEDAYAVGQLVTEMKVASGRTIKGHKIGYTSKAMRDGFGAKEPDYGTLFDDWFVPEGTQIPSDKLNRPWIEIELLFVLKTDLGGPSVNEADVISATDYIMPSIEVCDSRYTYDDPDGGIIDSIADAASCGLITIGGRPIKLTDCDPRHVGAAFYINGEVVESGTGAAVMGNPINAVAWLARKLASFDVRMEAGHSVLSGSFIAARAVAPGDSVVADFGPYGQISLGFCD